jgi:hypothetical protein
MNNYMAENNTTTGGIRTQDTQDKQLGMPYIYFINFSLKKMLFNLPESCLCIYLRVGYVINYLVLHF